MTAQEIMTAWKAENFFQTAGTAKIAGHKTITLVVPRHCIHDCWVWGSGSKNCLARINLRADDADEKLAKYFA